MCRKDRRHYPAGDWQADLEHHAPDILDLAPSLLSLFDHLTDDFGNLSKPMQPRDALQGTPKAHLSGLQWTISLEHLEHVYPGGWRLVRGVKCAEKYLVTNFQIFEAVILRMSHCLFLIERPDKVTGFGPCIFIMHFLLHICKLFVPWHRRVRQIHMFIWLKSLHCP